MQTVSEAFTRASKADMLSPVYRVSLFGNNLAFGKPVTVSSFLIGWEGSKAVDAVIEDNYGWSSQDVGSERPIAPETIIIDLLWQTEIDRVILYPRIKVGIVYCFPIDFEIQVSKNNEIWTTVVSNMAYSLPSNQDGEIFDFPKQICRYVRVLTTKFRQSPELYWAVQFAEIHVIKRPVIISGNNPAVAGNYVLSVGNINWELDTTGQNVWKSGNVRIEVDNSDNVWSPTNSKGLFAYQRYFGARVSVDAGFVLDDGTAELVPIFKGQLQDAMRHSDTIASTLTAYSYWEKLERVDISSLKDTDTGIWYANKRVDFLVRQIFAFAGLTRFEFVVDAAITVIPNADFNELTAQQGISWLAEVMNFECGIDQKGLGFFRARQSGGIVNFEARNKKNGDKNLISVSNIDIGVEGVTNHWTTINSIGNTLSKEPVAVRPNTYDRFGHIKKEIVNKFLSQMNDSAIMGVLTQYFDMYSEPKMEVDCEIVFSPQVEVGDIHEVTQQELQSQGRNQLTWDVNETWNRGFIWGSFENYLVRKKVMKVVGLSIDLAEFTMRIKYKEV
ncbi:MAG: discoidin domain-containing protein [bacterium]|nr:discoidin domain-containing protein [bacterium]